MTIYNIIVSSTLYPFFNIAHTAKGEATITLSVRAGDKTNVIAQQCCSRFNGSQQEQPRNVVLNSTLRYQQVSSLTVARLLGDIRLSQLLQNTLSTIVLCKTSAQVSSLLLLAKKVSATIDNIYAATVLRSVMRQLSYWIYS